MTHRAKIVLTLFIAGVALINLLISAQGFAAESTVTITSTPFLGFSDIPDSLNMGYSPFTVPVTDETRFSDVNGPLPATRSLTVQDTRNSGGFILQLDASAFSPAPPSDLRNNLRVLTTGVSELYSGETPVGGIVYLPADGETSFIGNQTVSAPVNSATTNFGEATTFTAVSGNVLNTTVDLMDGCLASGGRKGKMNVHTAFDIVIPKYTVPPSSGDRYYSTLTYTLSDYTPVSCP